MLPTILPDIPELEEWEPEEEQELAALQLELLHSLLNNESAQQWPRLFDKLEEEELEVILCLEAEEVAAILEAEEAQQRLKTLHKYPSSLQPTSNQ